MEKARITCEDVEILMQDYLDGYLLDSQRRDLEEHLDGCSVCRDMLISMKRLEEQLEGNIPVEVPSGFEEAVVGRLPKSFIVRPWAGRVIRFAGMGMAAGIAMIFAVMMIYSPGRQKPGIREVEIVFHSPHARSVHVAGDFNNWDIDNNSMTRETDGTWKIRINLTPGLYQYNFYIDNEYWAEDPGTAANVSDGFGGRNALLFVEG